MPMMVDRTEPARWEEIGLPPDAAPSGRRAGDLRVCGPGLWEVLAVWMLCAAMALSVFATYARVSPKELYHVGHSGLAGGASRTVVVLNVPVAIVVGAVLGVVVAQIFAHPWAAPTARRRAVVALASLALALCLLAAWPGVVTEKAYDARLVNAVPVLGVGIVLALTMLAVRVCGIGPRPVPGRSDILRIVVGACLLVAALPWILADLGFYIGDVPGLGALYVSKDFIPAGAALPAVHLGHHHGADGVIFAMSALLLTRTLHRVPRPHLRAALSLALALMLVYGLANATQDSWDEQVVKRGWTTVSIRSVLWPAITPAWGVLLAAAGTLHLLIMRAIHRPSMSSPR